MKLKGLPNRIYNITFHTHTVSGIVISFALYVIFFAGAFTLFKNEFYQWENIEARQKVSKSTDVDAFIAEMKQKKPNFDLTDDMTILMPSEEKPMISFFGHLKTTKGKEEHFEAKYYPASKKVEYEEKTTIGETLYRLHFLDQVPYFIGRYVAGFVALFFLFASITGLLIHWRNIITKFYGFSLKGSLKQLWTNAHTVFGLLGLPFQVMYAVTGAFYILSILVLVPAVMVFYGGDQKKVFELIRPSEAIVMNEKAPQATNNLKISTVLTDLEQKYPNFKVKYIQLKHYDKQDALMTTLLVDKKSFTGDGYVSTRLSDGKNELTIMPGKKTYIQSVLFGIARIHFATFGGLLLKTIYFLMALFTCFVIISGVLLWKEARNKKEYSDKQKRFHHRVTMSYLAICFGLFPATAVLFIAELIAPNASHIFWVNTTFFVSWLVLAVAGLFFKNEAKMTHFYLFSGGILSLFVPIANGLKTNDWLWKTLQSGNYYIAGTDIFWLVVGFICLIISYLIYANKMGIKPNNIKAKYATQQEELSIK